MNDTADLTKYDEYLTVPEVAVVMRVSKMTVYRMIHRGDLDAIRVGRGFRIASEEVKRALRTGIPVTTEG
jgi:excisionase family DNA binding protein